MMAYASDAGWTVSERTIVKAEGLGDATRRRAERGLRKGILRAESYDGDPNSTHGVRRGTHDETSRPTVPRFTGSPGEIS
jgi:hypothetical protein